MSVTIDSQEFERHLRAGDYHAAGEWLAHRHRDDVMSLCRCIVRDDATAEDLAHDAFVRAFGGLPGFRGEASPRTWLLAIARNCCIDHLRREQRSPSVLTGEPETGENYPDENAVVADLLVARRDLERAFGTLPESERALVVLHFEHGVQYGELAEIFGVKSGALRMRVSRALAKMRDALEPGPASATVLGGEAIRTTALRLRMSVDPEAARKGLVRALQRERRGRRGRSPTGSVPAATPPPGEPFGEWLRTLQTPAPESLVRRLGALLASL